MSLNAQIGERLREERKRIHLSQQEIASAVDVRREMWAKYEAGAEPGAFVLSRAAAAGIDVGYVLSGQRGAAWSPDEQLLVSLYREASAPVRTAVMAALGATARSAYPAAEASNQPQVKAVAEPVKKYIKRRRAGVEITAHGSVVQQVDGDITAPQTLTLGQPPNK